MKNAKFKDSGVQWLGEIPQHWEVVPNKYIFELNNEIVGQQWQDYKLLSLSINGIVERDMDNPKGKFPTEFNTYQKVRKGDFVFCLFDFEETPRCVGLSNLDGMITGAYTILRNKTQNSKYLFYLYLSLDNAKALSFMYRGLRKIIPKDDFFALKIPLPPLDEQRRIAEFLDKKCAKIAEFIDKKQQIISLLKEQKLALINESTCGRIHTHNDNQTHLKFKHSGIEWLGEIPQHWEIRKLKFVVTQRNDKAGENDFKIGLENIESQTGKFIQTDENPFDDCGIKFKAGDILFGKLRPYLAKVYLTEQSGSCVSEFLVLNAIDIDCFFLKFLMLSHKFIQIVNSATYGTKMPRASWEFIGNLKIPLPPLDEQRRIAKFLDKKCEKIDKAIALIEQEIQAIKEYKTSLIDKAVRGGINV